MSPPPKRSSECHSEKDTLLRPKTQATKPMAKMAPMDVWDNQIIATFEYMTENAKRAKAILLAQNDPEADIPYEEVQAACLTQAQMNAEARELTNKYRWAQRVNLQSTSSSTYDGHHPQTHPKEKNPAKQAAKLPSNAYPGGKNIESRPKSHFCESFEHQKVICGRKKP